MKTVTITRLAATFIVRMWREPSVAGAGEWRGQVEHVQSGDKQYFHEMDKLLDFLAQHLATERDEDLNHDLRVQG